MNFLENSGFDIGSVNGTTGLTATNAYLSSTGTVTQSQAIAATNLDLLGTAGRIQSYQHRQRHHHLSGQYGAR